MIDIFSTLPINEPLKRFNVIENVPEDSIYLHYSEDGLALARGELRLRVDFSLMQKRLQLANLQHEMLIKAIKGKGEFVKMRVVDATAGLGEDSVLLASFGYEMTMFELNPVIYALLDDGIRRARNIEWLSPITSKMNVINGNSIDEMRKLLFAPDVILLDPMFPERQKSGLVKKKFQLLHELECPCTNEAELLESAISARPKKIVIKRPLKGRYLADRKPSYSLCGDAIRYDCILFPENM